MIMTSSQYPDRKAKLIKTGFPKSSLAGWWSSTISVWADFTKYGTASILRLSETFCARRLRSQPSTRIDARLTATKPERNQPRRRRQSFNRAVQRQQSPPRCRCLRTLVSSALPIASIIALNYIDRMIMRLLVIALFTMGFSLILTLMTNARRVEVFAATAA